MEIGVRVAARDTRGLLRAQCGGALVALSVQSCWKLNAMLMAYGVRPWFYAAACTVLTTQRSQHATETAHAQSGVGGDPLQYAVEHVRTLVRSTDRVCRTPLEAPNRFVTRFRGWGCFTAPRFTTVQYSVSAFASVS